MQNRLPEPGKSAKATIQDKPPIPVTMKLSSEPIQNQKKWTFYGEGSMGDKAQQLHDKTGIIEQAGFTVNPRTVLNKEWFRDFLDRSGFFDAYYLPQKERLQTITEGTFSSEEKATLRKILRQFEGVPLAVRSSAEGDARGTGIYHSGFSENNGSDEENLHKLETLIKDVIKSAENDSAIEFRRKMKLMRGMSVMIEPVFGTEYSIKTTRRNKQTDEFIEADCKWFCPQLSGIGYTSTASGEGYVVVSGGLPTNAVSGKGLRIELNEENASGTIMDTDAYWERRSGRSPSFLLEHGDSIQLSDFMNTDAGRQEGNESLSLQSLANKLKVLEELAGRPQYVEFAIRFIDGKEEIAILQIADAEIEKEVAVVPEVSEGTVVTSTEVIGEGTCLCETVFLCPPAGSLNELFDFNEKNTDYLLIVDSYLLSDISPFKLRFSYFSNASAIIVQHNHFADHGQSVSEHFKGLFDVTDKLVLVADWDTGEFCGGLLYEKGILFEGGLNSGVRELKVEVSVSEIQKKGTATIIEV